MNHFTAADRLRAFGYFVLACVYFEIAEMIAGISAAGFPTGQWSDLVERSMMLFLLLLGYGLMGKAFQKQLHPIQSMGLMFRGGWKREFGLGTALGWGMLLVSILPIVLTGGLLVTFWTVPRQFFLLLLDIVALAVAALVEEVVFRGYPFQRLIEAVGPTMATLVLSLLFALRHIFNPSFGRTSLVVTVFAGWLMCAAYLRTRALWFSWGWHFAWNACMGLLFGLPISGLTRFSPVIQSNTVGPAWLTGGDYGPEGSVVTAIVMLVGFFLVFRITRRYAFDYAQPVIRAAGMPVDLDAMGRVVAPHHPPAGETLVQIGSFAAPTNTALPSRSGTISQPRGVPDEDSSPTDRQDR